MGNLLKSNYNENTDLEYGHSSYRTKPFSIYELKQSGYNTILVDDFNKKELLKKYIDIIDLHEDKLLDKLKYDNFNKIIKMLNYCKKNSDKMNFNNMDCICNQNLDICFQKKQTTNDTIYNFMEYTINPPGRVFLRII